MKNKIRFDVISFHPGRQHNLEQAMQIANRIKSYKHITSLYFNNNQVKNWKRVSSRIGGLLAKRSFSINKKFVDINPWPELRLLLLKKMGKRLWYDAYISRNLSFQKWIGKNYLPPKICIGFDTCSWEIFEKWGKSSFLILDLSIAIPQYKLALARQTKLSKAIIEKLTHDDGTVYEIYKKEIEMADLILCGSQFVLQSCLHEGIQPEKMVILPYGIDISRFANSNVQPKNDTIKVAFIGAVTVRKGADILLKAWAEIIQRFPFAELHFYGKIEMEVWELKNVFYHGFVGQDTLIEELKRMHISVLPSFFEGSSLAVYQSMAMGLATITTLNSGSIVKDNENGFLVEYGSEQQLINKLSLLLEDENLRSRLAHAAIDDVKEYTWENYGKKLCKILEAVLQKDKTIAY